MFHILQIGGRFLVPRTPILKLLRNFRGGYSFRRDWFICGPCTTAYQRLDARSLEKHEAAEDRKSTRLNSSHANISYAVFCLEKKKRSTPRGGCTRSC